MIYDVTSAIMAFECGDLTQIETIELFAYLVETGMAWTLQGSYGRYAMDLINAGYIDREGKILTYEIL